MGADDYLTKDVSLPHLLARISALFRRVDALREPKAAEELLERGELRLDAKRFVVAWKEKPVELTLTEFWMVHTLGRFPGHVKDRESLMREANLVVDEGTVTSHIKRIRKNSPPWIRPSTRSKRCTEWVIVGRREARICARPCRPDELPF